MTIKKPEEIEKIRQGGKILAQILSQVLKSAKPGIKTIELDELAEKLIIEAGGIPSFKHYTSRPGEQPFPSTICSSVNNQLVHTPASDYQLQAGDILSVDIGMVYPAEGGFYTDMARTIPIGEVSAEAKKIIEVTKKSFDKAVAVIKDGVAVSAIGKAIEDYVNPQGFAIVRSLVGHGVGYEVHEDPRIPNFYDPKYDNIILKAGMVIAVEPMINTTSPDIKVLDDGWTIVAADGKLCAHHENTLVVTKKGFEILTQV